MNSLKTENPGRRALSSALLAAGTLAIIASLILISRPKVVTAAGGDLSNARAKYPQIVGTRIDSCSLCHTSSIPALNPYGSAYKNNGRNSAAFGLIESLDSDGDGFTNLQEINALTFPGDPNNKPAAPTPTPTRPSPTATATATRTALPTSTPTRTALPTNTPTRTAQPTSTPTRTAQPTNTATLPPQPTNTATLPPQPTNTATLPPLPTNTATLPPLPTNTATLPPQPTATPVTPTAALPTPTQTAQPTSSPTPLPTIPPSSADEIVITPSADAYVTRAERNSNFGKNTFLRVDASPTMRSYLRFEIPSLDGHPVSQVLLRLWANTGSRRGIFVRTTEGEEWSESGITFKNAPDHEGKAVKTGRFSGGDWIAIDITSLVKGEGTLDLVISSNDLTQSNMASRETGDHAPQLVVISTP